MKAHRTDGVSLVFGLLFVLMAAWWALDGFARWTIPNIGWLAPAGLIAIGLLGIVASVRSNRRSPEPVSPASPAYPATPYAPPPYVPPLSEPAAVKEPAPAAFAEPEPANVDEPTDPGPDERPDESR